MATQKDRRDSTRRLILETGRKSFGAIGFEATTIDGIAAEAGLAKGAIYHHYANKRAIFEAVFIGVASEMSANLVDDIQKLADQDPIAVLLNATRSFFMACAQPEVLQILLRDGPTVLGHADWHRLDAQYFGGLVTSGLGMAMEAGAIKQQPLIPLSRVMLGALQTAAIDCAQQNDYDAAAKEYLDVFEGILRGLR